MTKAWIFLPLISASSHAQMFPFPGPGLSKPVAAPVNYGTTTIGGTTSNQGAQEWCTNITTGSNAGGYSLQSISVYTKGNGGSTTMQVGVYTPSGASGTKVANSAGSTAITTSAAWQDSEPLSATS